MKPLIAWGVKDACGNLILRDDRVPIWWLRKRAAFHAREFGQAPQMIERIEIRSAPVRSRKEQADAQ